uniref:Putative secreted salivary gland peptide n=1 Tax=Ixodes ricinus TaxID=34613 RepID=A0A090XE76_IXORI
MSRVALYLFVALAVLAITHAQRRPNFNFQNLHLVTALSFEGKVGEARKPWTTTTSTLARRGDMTSTAYKGTGGGRLVGLRTNGSQDVVPVAYERNNYRNEKETSLRKGSNGFGLVRWYRSTLP